MGVEREGKRARDEAADGQCGRPKRQKVAPRRFVEEFREEIEQVLLQDGGDDVEGEDLHTDEGDEHDFLEFLEDQAELIAIYATEHELDHDTAARRLFFEEGEDEYESSFIDDDSEVGESEFVEEDEDEESAEETEQSTESSDTWKENVENEQTSDPDNVDLDDLELEFE